MGWDPISKPINGVKINGQETPGFVSFEGLASVREFAVHDGVYGLSGGSTRFRGRKLARFTIVITLFTPEDMKKWNSMEAMIEALPTGGKSWSVEHPALAAKGVSAVVFDKIHQMVPADVTGSWEIKLDCIEFKKPVAQIADVKAAKAGPQQDAIDKQTDENTATINALAAEDAK